MRIQLPGDFLFLKELTNTQKKKILEALLGFSTGVMCM